MVNDALQNMFQDADFQSNAFRIYTTLDMRLQRAAVGRHPCGMERWMQQISKAAPLQGKEPFPSRRWRWWRSTRIPARSKRWSGGRNYGMSQLNHVLREAPAGVDLQALRLRRGAGYRRSKAARNILTPSTMILDEPTTFWFDNQPYEPSNFEHKFYGDVTVARGAGAFAECRHRESGARWWATTR